MARPRFRHVGLIGHTPGNEGSNFTGLSCSMGLAIHARGNCPSSSSGAGSLHASGSGACSTMDRGNKPRDDTQAHDNANRVVNSMLMQGQARVR